jgi:NitT/TauT family transport system substrate-binding protein
MKKLKWAGAIALATALMTSAAFAATNVSSSPSSSAKHQARTRVTIMVGGMSKIIYSAATLAKVLGYYEKAGIDVYPIDEPAGGDATTALVSGQVDGAMGYYNHTVDVASKGKQVECVVQIGVTPGHAVMVPTNSSIKSAKDWKGKTLGITETGSSTDFELQYIAKRAGISGDQFTRLGVGAGATFIAALQHGQIDGGITSQPTIGRLVSSGQAKVLIDLQNLKQTKAAFGGTFPSTCMYMRNDYVKAHPDAVQRLVNAYVWTLKWVATHSATQFTDKMPADYVGTDRAGYIQDVDQSKTFWAKNGIMPKDGPPTILKFLSTFNPTVANAKINLSQTYTNKFVLKAIKTKAPAPR